MELFPTDQIVGVFRGFQHGGLEFHADLVLPYRNDFQSIPMHGQFVLVQLESPEEAVLGRIATLSSEGRLSHGTGEEFNIRAVREGRHVPEDLREQYLKYKVNIRVLGILRNHRNDDGLTFVASHRRLPHVGSPVAFPSSDVLREIAGHTSGGATIGHLAYGEFVFAPVPESTPGKQVLEWIQYRSPDVEVKFPIESLVSRRSFIFARAGFGKSNLNKLLFSTLYKEIPTVTKRGGREVPVGTVLFDPDGEYFWPDDKGRPGLCDVPWLQDKLVVFTNRAAPSAYYGSFVAGGIKLDIRRLEPADVVGMALSPERQDQQNVRKLKGLSKDNWARLVNLVVENGYAISDDDIKELLHLVDRSSAEATAAVANMNAIVRQLHDPSSQLMDNLLAALRAGRICVIDVSQMAENQALILSALILRRIFSHNQDQFTAANPATVPTIAVVEEAQSVLNEHSSAASSFLAWVKEGRKYDLGAVLITQQPGSIPVEILSQGDNWFLFHLLSATDLQTLHRANAHFSDDLLSSLLNEPIPGHGVFWSSAAEKPYPLSIRALSFEEMHCVQDPDYNRSAVDTAATALRSQTSDRLRQLQPTLLTIANPHPAGLLDTVGTGEGEADGREDSVDYLEVLTLQAVAAVRDDSELKARLESGGGAAWGTVKAVIKQSLPHETDDLDQLSFEMVSKTMTELYGQKNSGWRTDKRPSQSGNLTTYIFATTRT